MLYTTGPSRFSQSECGSSPTLLKKTGKFSKDQKVSFIKQQVGTNGQQGLSMLIEDVNTSLKRTIEYVLDDVIDESIL